MTRFLLGLAQGQCGHCIIEVVNLLPPSSTCCPDEGVVGVDEAKSRFLLAELLLVSSTIGFAIAAACAVGSRRCGGAKQHAAGRSGGEEAARGFDGAR